MSPEVEYRNVFASAADPATRTAAATTLMMMLFVASEMSPVEVLVSWGHRAGRGEPPPANVAGI